MTVLEVYMFIRKAMVMALPVLATLTALPDTAAAQAAASTDKADAASVIQAVRGSIGKEFPTRVRVTAGGSGYAPGADPASQRHYRIASYVQELDVVKWAATERLERVETAEDGNGSPESDEKSANATAPWPEQHVIWVNPLGFLTQAAARPVTLASETVLGTPYRALTFTTPDGHTVRGYVTHDNVLERATTKVGDRQVESVFMEWQDFDGTKYPSLIIEKTNGDVARILIVTDVDRL